MCPPLGTPHHSQATTNAPAPALTSGPRARGNLPLHQDTALAPGDNQFGASRRQSKDAPRPPDQLCQLHSASRVGCALDVHRRCPNHRLECSKHQVQGQCTSSQGHYRQPICQCRSIGQCRSISNVAKVFGEALRIIKLSGQPVGQKCQQRVQLKNVIKCAIKRAPSIPL